jgi:1-acyl-sn-glycerol-3-phosphate acyltransferase
VSLRRSLRAVGRLARVVAHGLHGVWIVLVRFPALDAAGRHAAIARWSRGMLARLGIALRVEGDPRTAPGTLLCVNHVSWLDIMAVHAVVPEARFVSKAAVRDWPVVRRLVDSAGTLYLERERKRDALRVVGLMADALRRGETVAVFPEGTTSTGHGLLPFHANLLQAAVAAGAPARPVALRWSDATHAVSEAMEFVGDTTMAESLWKTANGEGVVATLRFLPPRDAAGADRRALAAALREDIVRALGVDAAPSARRATPPGV